MQYYRQYQNLGMHRNVSIFSVLKGEWKKIVNWDIDKKGCLTKRKGYEPRLNAPDNSEILSLIPFEVGSVRKLIMINASGNLYVADPATDSTWGTAILTGLNTSARWTATVLHDSAGTGYMILGNGYQVYKTSDATTFSAVSGAPLAKYWCSFQERVFAAGVPADKDVLHWCSIGDLTNWSAVSPSDSSSLNIDKHSGGVIRAIRTINDRVVIWKQDRMKRYDEEYLRTLRASNGVDAPYSISEVDGMAFSLDRNAIRLYDGNSPIEISEKIKDLIDGIDFSDANKERICGKVFKEKYFLATGDINDEDGNTIANAWIVYDYNKNAFWLYSLEKKATAMTKLMCSDGVERLYFGSTNGQIYQMFSGDTDNGTEIEAMLEGHVFYPVGPENYIQPKEFIIASKYGHQIKAQITDDYADNTITIGEYDKPVDSNLIGELGSNVLGVRINIVHATKGRPIFYGFSLGYEIEGYKKSI